MMAERRVLICGDRNYKKGSRVNRLIRILYKKYGRDLVIIEGGATGADSFARKNALAMGIPVITMFPPWEFGSNAAGPIRNGWMIKVGRPHEAYAFHPDILKGKGTKDMVKKLEKAGIPHRVLQ